MSTDSDSLKREIKERLKALGAAAAGFARAEQLPDDVMAAFDRWIAAGNHSGMAWLENHRSLRADPRTLLEGARTVVSIAFPYYQPKDSGQQLRTALYALGQDYHTALREALAPLTDWLAGLGVGSRLCIDSAPIAERFWAMRCGIGRLGMNGTVIIDGYGSYVFLCELLLTASLEPDAPSSRRCDGCGACLRACPGEALQGDGTLRASRCLSYLTIEHRGDWPEEGRGALDSEAGRATFFGCDICQDVCPHNRGLTPPRILPQFAPLPLPDAATLAATTSSRWNRLSKGSALSRLRHADMLRNLRHIRGLK